jgi:2',3'-cyclic-nucleotide 2'-phosphodiesterase (5'-nucleotidase family)
MFIVGLYLPVMLRNKFLYPILMLFLASCGHTYVATKYAYQEKNITANAEKDEKLAGIIQPYKDSLDKQMNVVLGVADDALTKTQPESDLGNFMCDLVLMKSRDYADVPVDFTFLNHGGIRLPSLPKGDITLGKLIELMPFENRIGIMQLKGTTIDTLFNFMASKGGWHISGARYKIKNNAAIDITIAGVPLNFNKTYSAAVSDYLAQGGDNCYMLKGLPYTDTRKTIRDALIEGLQEMTAKGQHVKSVLDGRIELVN